MEIGFLGISVIIGIFLIWFWNSLYIIKEWERGVVLRLGRLIPDGQERGTEPGFLADRNAVPHSAADRDAGRAAAGHHHARQRFGEN